MTTAKIENPQRWLPVGQMVRVSAPNIVPNRFDEFDKAPVPCLYGQIVEHLTNGAVVVKFVSYPNTWDYNASEACLFERVYCC